MKKLFFILLVVCAATALGQSRKIKVEKEKDSSEKPKKSGKALMSYDVYYGQKIYARNLYSQLNTFDSLRSSLPVRFVGIGFAQFNQPFNPRGELATNVYFAYIIPQSIKVKDSLDVALRGFIAGVSLGKTFYTNRNILGVAFYVGFNSGYTRMKNADIGGQINPFFSPKITIQPKLNIKYVSLAITCEYDYDISNPAWKSFKTIDKEKSLKTFSQSGLSLMASLGFVLWHS